MHERSNWLISDNVVVTAGHCVKEGGGAWANIHGPYQMCVGYQVSPVGAWHYCGVKRLYSTNEWVTHKDDYAAIELTCNFGKRLGHLGYGWTTAALAGRTVRISSYFESNPQSVPCTQRRLLAIAYFLCWGSDRVSGRLGQQLFVGTGTGIDLVTSGALILADAPAYAIASATNQKRTPEPEQPQAKEITES